MVNPIFARSENDSSIGSGSVSSTGNSSQLSPGSVSALGNHNQWFVDTEATHCVTPDATRVTSAEDFSSPEKLITKEASFSNACKSAALEVLPVSSSQLRGPGCVSASSAPSQLVNIEPCVSRSVLTAPVVVQAFPDQLQTPLAVGTTVGDAPHTDGRSAGLVSDGTSSPIRSRIAGVGEPAAVADANFNVDTCQEVLSRDSTTANSVDQFLCSGNVHSDTVNFVDRAEAVEDFNAFRIADNSVRALSVGLMAKESECVGVIGGEGKRG
ncbi:hypothetical protein V6N12_050303 [Hibiscus sabdariffa]|uniref:Uncharacterized protein n=1 Tax=Hibiscus sabdariffa TaxID=183260 RepID=A0ABR2GC19_9ROSI